MAKLIHDRDSIGYNDFSTIQDFKVFVQAAINAYNKTHSTKYTLVEVVRAFRSLPIDHLYSLYFKFTAKLDVDDAGADAKTFQAVIGFSRGDILLSFVRIVDAHAIPALAI